MSDLLFLILFLYFVLFLIGIFYFFFVCYKKIKNIIKKQITIKKANKLTFYFFNSCIKTLNVYNSLFISDNFIKSTKTFKTYFAAMELMRKMKIIVDSNCLSDNIIDDNSCELNNILKDTITRYINNKNNNELKRIIKKDLVKYVDKYYNDDRKNIFRVLDFLIKNF